MHGIIFIAGAPLVGALSVDPRMLGKDRAGTRPAPTTYHIAIYERKHFFQEVIMI